MSVYRHVLRSLCLVLTPMLLIASLVVAYTPAPVGASSHREAPLIAYDPQADNTDTYAFISPDRTDSVTIVANWIPLQSPYGAPNYFEFGEDVLYELHVDNVGDGQPNITYQFEFTSITRNQNTFLYNTGPIDRLNDRDWNAYQTYSFTEVYTPRDGEARTRVYSRRLRTPPVNIGSKSTPDYESLAEAATYVIGRESSPSHFKLFAGQRDDPFFIDLSAIFDLLSLRGQDPPIGYTTGPNTPYDGIAGYNVHTIALQVPISRLLRGAPDGETVVGIWATSSRQATRVLSPGSMESQGDYVQVSRLGMPLVNEVVLPLALKDAFNGLKPADDFGLFSANDATGRLFRRSVLNPELQRLLSALYDVPNPGTNRTDLVSIFLTGMQTAQSFTIIAGDEEVEVPAGTSVNQPLSIQNDTFGQPAEMIRINTAELFRPGVEGSICSAEPNYDLGVLGGDVCGFPNGRRLQDDILDISLLAVAGAGYSALTGNEFDFNADLIEVLDDGIDANDKEFLDEFPYVPLPHQGQEAVQR